MIRCLSTPALASTTRLDIRLKRSLRPNFQRTPPGLNAWRLLIFCVCAAIHAEAGGASRDRTDDPLLAKQVLSQLSYGPKRGGSGRTRTTDLTLIRGAL